MIEDNGPSWPVGKPFSAEPAALDPGAVYFEEVSPELREESRALVWTPDGRAQKVLSHMMKHHV